MIKQGLTRLGLMCIACAAFGWICGGLQDVATSYIISIIGGVCIWFLFFGEYFI